MLEKFVQQKNRRKTSRVRATRVVIRSLPCCRAALAASVSRCCARGMFLSRRNAIYARKCRYLKPKNQTYLMCTHLN